MPKKAAAKKKPSKPAPKAKAKPKLVAKKAAPPARAATPVKRAAPVKPVKPAKSSAPAKSLGTTNPAAAAKPIAATKPGSIGKAKKSFAPASRSAPAELAPPERPTYSSGLSKDDIAEFHDLLINKRRELLHDMDTMQAEALAKNRQDAAGDLSSMPIHMADLGSDNYEQEFTLGLIQGERQILREIDDALERIRKGAYGLCVATGKPIGKSRLRAQPWARYCYDYMLSQEKNRYRRI